MLKPVLEIIYIYAKGVGWTPEVVREDVRHAAKRMNFGVSAGWRTVYTDTTQPFGWAWEDFTR